MKISISGALQLHMKSPESFRPEHQAGVAFTNFEVQLLPGIDGRVYLQVESQ